MMMLKNRLQDVMARIDGMELRERLLLLGATVAVLYLLADTLVLQPTLKAQKAAQTSIADLQIKMNGLRQNAQLFVYRSETDPLAAHRESRDALASQLAELDTRILDQLGALVEPTEAAHVLEQILGAHPGLSLAALEARSQPLDLDGGHTAGGLARYQLDMVVKGNYLDVLKYLQNLEAMPWKFFWQQVEFQSIDYPQAETRLQLYTLGAHDA